MKWHWGRVFSHVFGFSTIPPGLHTHISSGGMDKRSFGAAAVQTYSYPIDMNIYAKQAEVWGNTEG
jgi:hypothetical protein